MSVLVFAENWDGVFKKSSFELVSYGTSLAGMLGIGITAVTIGKTEDHELEKLARFGSAKIYCLEGDQTAPFDSRLWSNAISEIALRENATVVLFSNNNTGKALAPRVSVKLKAGLASGVSMLPLTTEPFTVYRKVFSGNAFSHLQVNSPVKVITLAQNSFELIENQVQAVISHESFQPASPSSIQVQETQKQTGKILLTDAEIVVSGGRGMKSPDNWGPITELAGLLGAATACSRPVSDEGWRPHDEHTGQTGKVIAPNLYIAIGISGATQHLAGVSSSKYIVAINTDKDAPIFSAAQYGIIGDASKVLPKLVDAVKEAKGK
jgi:electron transfer flavoprotein alpha subunit